ncbi:MAG: NAD-dependent epimerase/dehydratase family protein [Candidatus Aenigmatarchaeota archaeon]
MRILVTGGAGFIGSHLVDRLIKEGNEVIVIDNLSSGKKENIQAHFSNPNFKFYQLDLVKDEISYYFKNIDEVWHLAANSDVRSALKNTRIDIEQNILATYNVLEAMRKNNVRKIFFTSSSTVYGEAKVIPTPENHSTLIPISLYGASKLACEALISAYCHMFDMKAIIFRIANVIGPRMTHGVIYDFINKLRKNPNELEILGNGNQKKSYIYIDDCIDAMILIAKKCNSNFEIFNIGSEDWIEVRKIAEIICKNLGLNPNFKFTGGERGWPGDVSLMLLDISKAKSFGWHPKTEIIDAIEKTIQNSIYDIRKAENIW